jgi:hypothetical protein
MKEKSVTDERMDGQMDRQRANLDPQPLHGVKGHIQ